MVRINVNGEELEFIPNKEPAQREVFTRIIACGGKITGLRHGDFSGKLKRAPKELIKKEGDNWIYLGDCKLVSPIISFPKPKLFTTATLLKTITKIDPMGSFEEIPDGKLIIYARTQKFLDKIKKKLGLIIPWMQTVEYRLTEEIKHD
jgi:hypothetical protein